MRDPIRRGRAPVLPVPGDLLVAAIGPQDRYFDRAVVLVVEADDTGTVGVVLNHYAPLDLEAALPAWSPLVTPPQVLFRGGPVEPTGALCLSRIASGATPPPGWEPIFSDVGLLHLDTPTELIDRSLTDVRIFSGYSGWGPDQLRGELDRGLWYPVCGHSDDVFTDTPEDLWRAVLRRSKSEVAFYSTWTEQPELN